MVETVASRLAVNLGFCGVPGFTTKKSRPCVSRSVCHAVETLRLTRSLITRNEDVNARFRVSQVRSFRVKMHMLHPERGMFIQEPVSKLVLRIPVGWWFNDDRVSARNGQDVAKPKSF